jgi:hypothetical protein
MAEIFVSYGRKSETAVGEVVNILRALGNDVWQDQDQDGGMPWWDGILERIRNCDVFVFALTPQAMNTLACAREFEYAHALGKPVLPLLLANGVSLNLLPEELTRFQYLDCRVLDSLSTAKLAKALATLPEPGPLPSPLPPQPEVPVTYLGRETRLVRGVMELDKARQWELLGDLKGFLDKPRYRDDAIVLLKELGERPDVLASVAREVDQVLCGAESLDAAAPAAGLEPGKGAETPVTGNVSGDAAGNEGAPTMWAMIVGVAVGVVVAAIQLMIAALAVQTLDGDIMGVAFATLMLAAIAATAVCKGILPPGWALASSVLVGSAVATHVFLVDEQGDVSASVFLGLFAASASAVVSLLIKLALKSEVSPQILPPRDHSVSSASWSLATH